MPVPKRKTSKSRRNKRASSKKITFGSIARCQTCQEPVGPHQVCKACGYYKGTKILKTKTDRMYERSKQQEDLEAQKRAEKALGSTDSQKEKK